MKTNLEIFKEKSHEIHEALLKKADESLFQLTQEFFKKEGDLKMKNKTLNDLKHKPRKTSSLCCEVIDLNILKQKAIKLAKEFGSSHICKCCGKWLDFLNITEDDLK